MKHEAELTPPGDGKVGREKEEYFSEQRPFQLRSFERKSRFHLRNSKKLGDPLEEGMATHSSILAWRNPMDRGAWQATIHEVTKSRTE